MLKDALVSVIAACADSLRSNHVLAENCKSRYDWARRKQRLGRHSPAEGDGQISFLPLQVRAHPSSPETDTACSAGSHPLTRQLTLCLHSFMQV